MQHNDLLLALGGATGSGKTALAIALAKQHPELTILSADSRQIYKKLDIGTAKIGEASTNSDLTDQPEPVWIAGGVPQFLIDIAEPNTTFTLTDYQTQAYRLIRTCWNKGRVPLLVGGTGLYLQAVLEGYSPEGGPDYALRSELEQKSLEELQHQLDDIGGAIAETDSKNKRRLIRAIERTIQGTQAISKQPITANTHTFVLQRPWEEQRDLAPAMVQERLDLGLVQEIKHLLAQGIDKEWLKNMGLSYRLVIRMLDGEFPEYELKDHMIREFRQLMRRQRTWFNRMPNAKKLTAAEISEEIGNLLNK